MNIGDRVTIRNKLAKCSRYGDGGRKVFWRPSPFDLPASALYLGTTMLYDGIVSWSGDEEGNTFTRTGQIAAVVVQPLDRGNRYRRPIYARPEDVEQHP